MTTGTTSAKTITLNVNTNLTTRIKLFPALAISLIGLLILATVGFAGTDVLHNAAHDIRHGLAFPCH